MLAVTANGVIAVAAAVQAAAAIAIFFLNRSLVKATNKYVTETQRLAQEAARTNELSERNTDRSMRSSTAVLEVRQGGRNAPNDERGWEFLYVVENVGVGIAHGAVLAFEDGEADPLAPLRPQEQANAVLRLPADYFPPGTPGGQIQHPELSSAIFQSADGTWWTQRVRRGVLLLPEVTDL